MTVKFIANVVEIVEEFETLIVGFTDGVEAFQIQYALEEDEYQQIYFERNDQTQSCWDEVIKLIFTKNYIEVDFTAKGEKQVECQKLRIDFSVDFEKQQSLLEKTAFIFKNKTYAEIISGDCKLNSVQRFFNFTTEQWKRQNLNRCAIKR
ncbi:MAG: Imm10 family immunity protein [Spirosomataceae bacterium]